MIQRSEPEMLDLELLPVKPLQSLPNKLIQQRKKNLVKLQRLVNIRIDSKLSSLRGGNLKCWIWRHYRINWYNKNADVVSSELFIFGKEKKNSWNHHKERTHRKILARKIKNARKDNTPYYYLLDAFVYLLNNCCDTQFINFCASNWKKKWYMS